MKIARLFLAVLTAGTLAACNDSATAPEARPADASQNGTTCVGRIVAETQPDGTIIYRCTGQIGSGG